MGVQIGREIARGVVELGHDPIMDVGDQPLADLVEHALFELLAHFFPIDRQLAHMGDRNQRVERAHPFGRHGRIGHAGVVEIDREIGRQHAAAIDIVKQPLIARAEQDHVVRNAGPGALQAKMHHEQAWRKALARQALGVILAPLGLAEKVLVAVHDVGIAGDRVEPLLEARFRLHLGRAGAERVDALHRIVEPDGAAQSFEMRYHRGDQPIGAALGPPYAAILFQLVDQGVDRAGLHRIAADQQRVEAERFAQLLVFDEMRYHRIDAAPRLLLRERGRGLQHGFEIEEGDMAQLDVAFLVHACAIFEEALISRDVGGIDLGNLVEQIVLVVRIIEQRPIGPLQAIEGHYGHELDILGHVVAGQRP